MSVRLKLQEMTEDQLHISFSQVRTWLECGLKSRYVKGMQLEKIRINPLFRSATHGALEHYYPEVMTRDGAGPIRSSGAVKITPIEPPIPT